MNNLENSLSWMNLSINSMYRKYNPSRNPFLQTWVCLILLQKTMMINSWGMESENNMKREKDIQKKSYVNSFLSQTKTL
jgi:hypothetical protein